MQKKNITLSTVKHGECYLFRGKLKNQNIYTSTCYMLLKVPGKVWLCIFRCYSTEGLADTVINQERLYKVGGHWVAF